MCQVFVLTCKQCRVKVLFCVKNVTCISVFFGSNNVEVKIKNAVSKCLKFSAMFLCSFVP